MADISTMDEATKRRYMQYLELKEAEGAAAEPVADEPVWDGEEPSLGSKIGHVAKGAGQTLVKEMLDLPNTLTTAVRGGLDATMGLINDKTGTNLSLPNVSGSPSPFFGTMPKFSEVEAIKPYVDAISSENFPREAAPAWDSARTAVEYGIGAITPNRKVDLAMAGGATIGEAITDYMGGDGDLGQLAALPAALLSMRKGKVAKADQKALDYIDEVTTIDDVASGTRIRKSQQILDEARAAIGEEGTLADVTGNNTLYDVEAGIAATNPRARETIDGIEAARQAQIAKEIRSPFGVETLDASQVAAGREIDNLLTDVTDSTKTQIDESVIPYRDQQTAIAAREQAALDAQAAAARRSQTAVGDTFEAQRLETEAGLPLASSRRTDQTSSDIAGTYQAADEAFDAATVRPAWKKFDDSADVEIAPIKEAAVEVLSDMSVLARKDLEESYGKELRVLDKMKGEYIGSDVQRVIGNIKAKLAKVKEGGGKYAPADIEMQKIVNAMEDSLTESNPAYRDAVAATKALYDTYRPGKVGKVRSRSEPETLARDLDFADDAGAVTARLLEQSKIPSLQPQMVEHLKALASRSATGVDSQFVKKYEAVLDNLGPDVKAQFQKVADAKDASKFAEGQEKQASAYAKTVDADTAADIADTKAETSALEKALKADQDKITAKGKALTKTIDDSRLKEYATDPPKTVKRYLKSTTGVDDLGELYKEAEKLGQGKSFRGSVRDVLLEQLSTVGAKGQEAFKPKAIADFNKIRAKLVKSGVIDKNAANEISDALQKTTSAANRKAALKHIIDSSGTEWQDLLASGGSAVLLDILPVGGSQQLMVGGSMRRNLKSFLSSKKAQPWLESMERFMTHPQEYVKAAENAKSLKEANRLILTKMVGAANASKIMSEDE